MKLNYLQKLKNKRPVVHCITNTVTVNDCANALLAIGARPIMAEHPQEVDEIVSCADALLLNIGSITDSKISAMKKAILCASKKGIPITLDCVGVSSSTLRYNLVKDLIKIHMPEVIKGNASEIMTLCTGKMTNSGVDSNSDANIDIITEFSKNSVIAVTGETDMIFSNGEIIRIKNGCKMLSQITGTGCMIGCMISAFMTVCDNITAAKLAIAMMGICGELADKTHGTGSFRVELIDKLSTVTDEVVKSLIRIV